MPLNSTMHITELTTDINIVATAYILVYVVVIESLVYICQVMAQWIGASDAIVCCCANYVCMPTRHIIFL